MSVSASAANWWRWPLLPLAAVAGALAAGLVAALFFWLSAKFAGFGEEGWYFLYIVPLITSGIFGHVYVQIACAVAPRGKVIAGVVMATVLGLFVLLSVVLAWSMPQYSAGYAVQTTLSAIAMMIGAIAALVDVASELT